MHITKNDGYVNPLYIDYIKRVNCINHSDIAKQEYKIDCLKEDEANKEKNEIIKKENDRKELIIRLKLEMINYAQSLNKNLTFPLKKSKKNNCLVNNKMKRQYRYKVDSHTEKQDIKSLENIEKRSFKDWHIDHIVSVRDGYRFNIPFEMIGDISNLRVISSSENYKKGNKSDVVLLENMLIPVIFKSLIKSILIFHSIVS